MKKFIAGILALTLAVTVFTSCSGGNGNDSSSAGNEESTTESSSAIPWKACATYGDAVSAAGFEFKVPSAVNGLSVAGYSVRSYSMMQVFYGDTASDADGIFLRKELSNALTDITDDENSELRVVTIGNYAGKIKGTDSTITSVYWNDGSYNYSVCIPSGTTSDNILQIASSLLAEKDNAVGEAEAETTEASGWTQCSSAAEAALISSVSLSAPQTLNGLTMLGYRAKASAVQAVYGSAGDNEITAVVEKITGTATPVLTTVTFESTEDITVGDKTCRLSYNGAERYLLTWTDGSYSYAVYFRDGVDYATITGTVSLIG